MPNRRFSVPEKNCKQISKLEDYFGEDPSVIVAIALEALSWIVNRHEQGKRIVAKDFGALQEGEREVPLSKIRAENVSRELKELKNKLKEKKDK